MKKAQSSLEVAILLGFMLFVFVTFLAIAMTRLVEVQKNKDVELIKDLATVITSEINLAFTQEEGYLRTFELPQALKSKNYTVKVECPIVSNYSVLILQYQDHIIDSEFPFIIPKVNGTLSKGANTITKTSNALLLNGGGSC
ncbi:hypothetical protein HZB01_02375 [Candidatus Woesearchaeota archaeon]|nr:hypothetical protein [Candidatus Woesearchaeota archaeon]